jgi:hypothetical protein
MYKFEIRVSRRNSKKISNIQKFKNYCRYTLPKKKGTRFQATPVSVMVETDKQTLFEILNELDKNSISVRTVKKTR